MKRKKVIFLTGASTGLGLAIAKQLIAEDKYMLVLSARPTSAARFKEHGIFESNSLWIRNLDIIDHQQITQVVDELETKLGGIDILINNAGLSEQSTVEDSSDSSRQRLLDVNYLAPFELIARVLPSMRRKKMGKIINISSAGGFMAMPTMSAYSASKFALEAASESLWYEMKPWGINVTLIAPGFINSHGYLNTSPTNKGQASARNPRSPYFEHYRGMRTFIARCMTGCQATNDSIAFEISKVIKKKNPPLRVHITRASLFLYWLRRLLPPQGYHHLIYRFLPNVHLWGRK